MLYGKGISKTGELIDVGVMLDIIDKSGSWFSYEGERIGQGRDKAKATLEEHPEIADEISAKIMANFDKLGEGLEEENLEIALTAGFDGDGE